MLIFIKQLSGLGNQLFQYAAGRYYANRYHAGLHIVTEPDRRALSHGAFPRPLLLTQFCIEAPLHEVTPLQDILLSGRRSRKAFTAPWRALRGIQVIHERLDQRFRFLPDLPLEPAVKRLYLAGYWQTHLTPDAVGETLRQELSWKHPAAGRNLEMYRRIASTPNAVSLHLRRGDYALAAEGNIVLSAEYYTRALLSMKSRVPGATFFVFSDDMAHARNLLRHEKQVVFVEGNNDFHAHEDLRLMAACRHHIIANSSFSWWGAWLNPRVDKIVIAPRHWHLTPNSSFPELFPPGWLTLDSLR